MSKQTVSSAYFHNMIKQIQENVPLWASHKKEVDELISRANSMIPVKKNAIIVGAGNLNDITLDNLLDDFNQVDLLDIDEESLSEVLKRYEGSSSNIKIIPEDVTGILDDQLITEFFNGMENKENEKIIEILNSLEENGVCTKAIFEQKYSLLIESTVSTQLSSFFGLCWQTLNPASVLELGIKRLAKNTTRSHLLQLQDGLDRFGLAVITSEQYEFSKQLPTGKYLSDPQDMLKESVQLRMESLGHFIRGRITKDDLTEANFNVISEKQWIWQFSAERFYLVRGWILSKNI